MFQSINTILNQYNFKKISTAHRQELDDLTLRLTTLEDYLGIKFYAGDHNKPHYRKKKTCQ